MCTAGQGGDMGDKRQQTEWLANAEICRRMAERSNDPVLRARWLTLAQQWIELCEAAPERDADSEDFERATLHKGSGHRGSPPPH